jgi:hypothetical protein
MVMVKVKVMVMVMVMVMVVVVVVVVVVMMMTLQVLCHRALLGEGEFLTGNYLHAIYLKLRCS